MIQRCRKTLHSRTKENRLAIQMQKALWRKLEPLFSPNKELHASKEIAYERQTFLLAHRRFCRSQATKEVKANAFASEGKSGRPETITTVTRYVSHDLSV